MSIPFFTRKAVVLVGMATALASAAGAQTNDQVFRSWDWELTRTGPEGIGMGGALVAIPDRADALAVNPAVLASLSRTEVFVSGRSRPAGTTSLGDARQSTAGSQLVGGGGMLTSDLAVGGFVGQPRSAAWALAPRTLPAGAFQEGYLRSTVTDVGIGMAWKHDRLHLGAQLVATHLFLEGASTAEATDGAAVAVGADAGDTNVAFTLGGMWKLTDTVTLGASRTSGTSWTARRVSAAGVPSTAFEVRRPSTLAGGASCQVSPNLLLTGQVDFVRYSEIPTALTKPRDVTGTGQYELADAFEPRAGLEFAVAPSNRLSVLLRLGARWQGSGAVRFTGSNVAEEATFRGRNGRVLVSGGASAVFRALRFDLAAEAGRDRTIVAGGVGLRF